MSECFRKRLIIFTRYPEPGKTKTRMIPALRAEGAADLQRRMTDHLVSTVKTWIEQRSLAVEIRFEGGSEKLMREWLGPSFSYRHQGRGHIDRRMEHAIADGFQDGCESVVIIGSDIPDISSAIIHQAFEELQKNNLVLGPAGDGGYYLIGVQKSCPKIKLILNYLKLLAGEPTRSSHKPLLRPINWEWVMRSLIPSKTSTVPKILRSGIALYDPNRIQPAKKRLSIIIPTLNEANAIEETITRLPKSEQVEIVVVDGGSSDGTAELARKLGIRVLSTAPSKAEQMNAGAAEARSEVLLFLHADTRLPANFEEKVMAAVSRKGFCAGAFTLGIDSDDRGLRFIERVANWRARLFKMPYGDQALFVSRQLFLEIGGFADYPIMEDFELIRRLKKKGTIIILPESAKTSPRRWQNLGVFKTWFLNQIIIGAYFIGIPPQRLAFWYPPGKGKNKQKKGLAG